MGAGRLRNRHYHSDSALKVRGKLTLLSKLLVRMHPLLRRDLAHGLTHQYPRPTTFVRRSVPKGLIICVPPSMAL